MSIETRKIFFLGSVVTMPASRAERLVQRGEAVYAETLQRSAPVVEATVTPPAGETATVASGGETTVARLRGETRTAAKRKK